MKIIAVDIGNSSIKLIWMSDGKVVGFERISENHFRQIENVSSVDAICISSVNPHSKYIVKNWIDKNFKGKVFEINPSSPFSFENGYHPPEALGVDRMCGAEGALFYMSQNASATSECVITADFGTATTINLIENHKFMGGYILPGVRLAIRALNTNTALLPKVDLSGKIGLFGNNTKHCMQTGIIQSAIALLEKFHKIYENKYSKPPQLFVTGGNAEFFIPLIRPQHIYLKELTCYGMYSIASKLMGIAQ